MAQTNQFDHLKLKLLQNEFKYVLFDNDSRSDLINALETIQSIPDPSFIFLTPTEKSAIVSSQLSFPCLKEEPGWHAFRIIGEMPFGSVEGLIAKISGTLAEHGLGVCIVSTYLTDYFFVRTLKLDDSVALLKKTGWEFV